MRRARVFSVDLPGVGRRWVAVRADGALGGVHATWRSALSVVLGDVIPRDDVGRPVRTNLEPSAEASMIMRHVDDAIEGVFGL